MELTVQIFHGNAWHDGASVRLEEPEKGRWSPSIFDYDSDYFLEFASEDLANDEEVIDCRAASVWYPVNLETPYSENWPGILADMLPQGNARQRMIRDLDLNDDPGADLELLLRTGGSPVGNVRLKEAFEDAAERITELQVPALTTEDIFGTSDVFREVADRFAFIASGSRGLQGEWPKLAMTQDIEGHWYPDPLVEDDRAERHVIVKLLKSDRDVDRLILESEAPYLEIARWFGLDVADPLEYRDGVLLIPRFDRVKAGNQVQRIGQESIYSALGIADGSDQYWTHEGNLAAILPLSTDPVSVLKEYVLRDVLNIALGNVDNHGRNTALHKKMHWVGLSPVFDLAPMKMAPEMVTRTTKWDCMAKAGSDYDPDWAVVCETVADGVMDPEELKLTLSEKANFVRGLPALADELGVPEPVIDRAISNTDHLADKLEELS
ncbi:MAG: HipA domain-containing protein [Roseibium album]|uniref:type II toxin-antitoxin system HipA family toxin n=1 Tax=Roseibium album TaxID=311410 RepID=UPI0032EBE195